MGRSRAVSRSAEDDPNQRAKRKKTVSAVGSLQNASTVSQAQETIEGKKALYHCNYCNKDISGMVRIKCALCPDFDLCIECLSVGVEVTPHKCNHPYRVMDNLAFPLICSDWNADEEMVLLEGIEMYGFGNWTEVAEHVGTKSKAQCIAHYDAVYLNSPCFPLPDMSHIMGKSREELLAMAKRDDVVNKESPTPRELTIKEEPPISARIQSESQKDDLACQSPSIQNTGTSKKASSTTQTKDSIKVEVAEYQSDRRIGEKKPRTSGDEGPSMTELSGYNFKRQEFEIEYDNDAEQFLADMEFKDSDTNAEHQLKLQVLHIYSKRLDERKHRKDFILERNLLYPDSFEKKLSPEEKEIYNRFKVLMRFHSKEEHEGLIRNLIEEFWIVKRIKDLQEARAAGCQTSSELKQFIEQKRKKEAEESLQRAKENTQVGSGGKVLPRPIHLKGEFEASPRGGLRSPTVLPSGKEASSTIANQSISISLDDWDISGFVEADLLPEEEKQLCCEMRILPSHYLNMLQVMSVEIMKGNITKKSDAHNLFKVEASKVDKVYDMLIQKGVAQA